MPSPFTGMDPFLEAQEWEDFHTTLNTVIREFLSPQIEPRYVVRVERRVYVEHLPEGEPSLRRADVLVAQAEPALTGPQRTSSSVAAAVAPVECLLPMPEERRETYLVIRDRGTMEVVTLVETLSPANKRSGSDGRREYLRKREEILESRVHLVELDLLRGGERLPTVGALPRGDYYAVVSRAERRPRAEVYAWSLRQPLPSIPVPLKKGDPDAVLELQNVFTAVYDRARYDLSLDYSTTLTPPVDENDAVWVAERLAAARKQP